MDKQQFQSLVNNFLHKFSGKLAYCTQIGNSLNFGHNFLSHCCAYFDANVPKICDFNGGDFPDELYELSFQLFVLENMMREGPCKDCSHIFAGMPKTEVTAFDYVSFNHFSKCNLKCAYCETSRHAQWKKTYNEPTYNVTPTLADMYSKGYINRNTLIAWGGGEPTIHEYFDEVNEFCLARGLTQNIDTSCVKYSESAAKALANGLAIVRCSPDSGTPETYRKVKGADCFQKVWENISQYSKIKPIILKYIVTPDNTANEDIEGFLQRCEACGTRLIFISPEFVLYHTPGVYSYSESELASIHKECISAASRLYKGALSRNIEASLSFWKSKDIAQIIV